MTLFSVTRIFGADALGAMAAFTIPGRLTANAAPVNEVPKNFLLLLFMAAIGFYSVKGRDFHPNNLFFKGDEACINYFYFLFVFGNYAGYIGKIIARLVSNKTGYNRSASGRKIC